MKVLHLESGQHLYGGPRQVLLLLRGLRAKGVENVLVCPVGSAIAAAAPDADLREMPIGGDIDAAVIPRLRRLIAEIRPDVIHLHSRRGADWLGGLAALRLGIPVVLSRRVDSREPRIFAVAKYSLIDRIIAISRAIEKVLIDAGINRDKVVCVPSAVPPMDRYPCDRIWLQQQFDVSVTAPVIGVIAQLIPRKGHNVLLDALPMVLSQIPDLRVLLFGRGVTADALHKQIEQLGLVDVVSFPGFRDDLSRILPCLDLVVHPALKEGLGIAVLQALQAGLPVVASDAGGIPEAVIDGQTGRLVPPGDAAALAQAVSDLLLHPDRAAALGERAAAYVAEHFSVEKMVTGNLAVYQSL